MARPLLRRIPFAAVTASLESARRDWEAGYRRFLQETSDPARSDSMHRQVEAVTEALRRRVGSTFTLDELAAAYADAERWAYDAVAEAAAGAGWGTTAVLAEDAAFHLYSRGAIDFEP